MTDFDEQLKQRLLAFQRAHGLDETGIAGSDTWTKLAETVSAGGAQAQLVGQVVPTVPGGGASPGGMPGTGAFPKIPGEGFGAGFQTASASGRVVAGGTQLGEGAFAAAEGGAVVTGATTTVAEGTVVVGGTTVAQGTIVSGGTIVRPPMPPPVGGLAAAGLVVVGALVVAGTIYFIVDGLSRQRSEPGPGEEYPGTSLPGGAPPPAVAPGANPPEPAQAPGTPQAPAKTPGANPATPATAPGASQHPVEAPGIVDDPEECLKLIKAGVTHDHHIFPRQFIHHFMRIGINIDEYTITLKWTEHIGANGLHSTMDWNGEWDIFFDNLPEASLTDGQKSYWYNKALKKGFDMMVEAGIDKKRVHPYRK
jgi:hypothetical protein